MKEARLVILENCLTAVQEAHDTLQDVHDEEEEAYDNMPEGLQDSERGEMMQEAIDTLDEAICSLDDAISYLEDVTNNASDPVVMEVDPWEKLKVGDVVTHKSFGPGTISGFDGKKVTIAFAERSAQFILPDAILKGYIIL